MRGKIPYIGAEKKNKQVVIEIKSNPLAPKKNLSRKGVTRLLCLAIILLQITSYFRTAVLRYGFQGLGVKYFNLENMGSIISFVFHLLIIFKVIKYLRNKNVINSGYIFISFLLLQLGVLLIYFYVPILNTNGSVPYWAATQELPYIYTTYLFIELFLLTVFGLANKGKQIKFWTLLNKYLLRLTFVFTVIFCLVWFNKESKLEGRQDAAIVLGAAVWSNSKPSPVFRSRIVKAEELLRKDIVGVVVLTGGNAPYEQAESEVAYSELMKMNTDPERIIKESQTHSTVSQVVYARDSIVKKGYSRIVFVSDDFHLFRVKQMSNFNRLNALFISSQSAVSGYRKFYYCLRETLAVALYWVFGL